MRLTLLVLFCSISSAVYSNQKQVDSLTHLLNSTGGDTTRLRILGELVELIQDEAIWSGHNEEALLLATKLTLSSDSLVKKKAKSALGQAYNNAGLYYNLRGDVSLALEYLQKSLSLRETLGIGHDLSETLHNLGVLYYDFGEYELAGDYLNKSFLISERLKDSLNGAITQNYLGQLHLKNGDYKKSLHFLEKSLNVFETYEDSLATGKTLNDIATVYFMMRDYDLAHKIILRSHRILERQNDKTALTFSKINFANILKERGRVNEALELALDASVLARETGFPGEISESEKTLYKIFEAKGNAAEALRHFKNHIHYRDSMKNESVRRLAALEKITFEFERRESQLKSEQEKKDAIQQVAIERQRTVKNVFIAGFLVVFALTFIILWQYRLKNRSNKKLNETLNHLEKTQSQLIHQEKMASLGMLTAGIAHEIQNPLNFVNNFAETSLDLMKEINQAVTVEEKKELQENLGVVIEKISQHGKRADSIIKSMLGHSYGFPEEKRTTNINKLSDEFLMHAYHGLRATHPEFHCTLEKNYQPDLPKAMTLSQEVSRVFLNLFTNAFHAVRERQKNTKDFQAVVSVTTRQNGNMLEIHVRDNGTGIPENIRSKIFQPFFTTKKSGEGTGLGLSISYDIVKAHGGEIKVNSEENSFTEFVVSLPV